MFFYNNFTNIFGLYFCQTYKMKKHCNHLPQDPHRTAQQAGREDGRSRPPAVHADFGQDDRSDETTMAGRHAVMHAHAGDCTKNTWSTYYMTMMDARGHRKNTWSTYAVIAQAKAIGNNIAEEMHRQKRREDGRIRWQREPNNGSSAAEAAFR